ncbi:MAG: YceD family protein [Steroidobacteraceae bacterium]
MLNGWSKPRDLAKLAEMGARFEFEIPVGELPGIPAEFALADGPAKVWMRFGRERGVSVADVRVQAVLNPQCQRCMREMRLSVDSESHVAVIDSEAQAAQVAEDVETFLAADGHGTLAALAAEELLLSLPLVPRHAAGEQCLEASASAEETQRPFADLRALLERGRK